MPTLSDIFKKRNIVLYQNESLDLDHYYQEPYQDNNELTNDKFDMSRPFETDDRKQKRHINIEIERRNQSNFAYFMDGSRRTYKIGDIVLNGKKIFPVVVAQVRAGCTKRNCQKKLVKQSLEKKNLLLISDKLNEMDFEEIKQRILRSPLSKLMQLEVHQYRFDFQKDVVPVNSAIGKANGIMHDMEIAILEKMVNSEELKPDKMLVVDGPLQFITQDNGKDEFSDLFYNVIGVSKSFDPMLSTSDPLRRGGTQVGTQLLKLGHADRTPVFRKENAKGRVFGFWYLRIRPQIYLNNPLEGIIKVEKMALKEDLDDGLNSDTVDTVSLSLLEEGSPTCHGKDERWANHLYPIYLTETMIKSSFQSDLNFIYNFKRNFK